MTTEKPNRMLHVPNLITGGRILAVPVTVLLILTDHLHAAFWLFALAALSDAADGLVARLFRARTKLGGWLDPAADKLLLVGTYVAMAITNLMPVWLLILVLLRDLIIIVGIAVLILALREKLSIQPLWIGKLNTFLQLSLVGLVLGAAGPFRDYADYVMPGTLVVAVSTVGSMVAYIMRGVFILRTRLGAQDEQQDGEKAE